MSKRLSCSIIYAFIMLVLLSTYVFGADTEEQALSKDGTAVKTQILETPDTLPEWFPKIISAQINGIYQDVPHFKNPYEGDNSFSVDKGYDPGGTIIYGVYFGSDLSSLITHNLQGYFDVEMAKYKGVGQGIGLGGFVNGDVVRTGSVNLGEDPYIARVYLRYLIPLSKETSKAERGIDQLPGNESTERIEIRGGKFSTADVFDQNRYANNTRTQFMNYSFITNTAYDYASDTRGYSWGIVLSYVNPVWQLTYAAMMVPTFGNGNIFDTEIWRARGDNLELTLRPNNSGTVLRLLTYFNQGRMGNYGEAIAAISPSSVRGDERPGRTKYGFGINFEQPLADEGETGLFARIGWNDGNNETYMYTEADREISAGAQVSGVYWGRSEDRLAMGFAINAISKMHQEYLADGGYGILIGDGALNYGVEQIFEIYYRVQPWKYLQITPDFQFIMNPGYNQARGPAEVYGIRVRLYI